MWEKISQWFADANGPVTIDGVVYISNNGHTIAMFAVVIIFGVFWCLFWYARYQVWVSKYMRRNDCVPYNKENVEETYNIGMCAEKDARDIKRYIEQQCKLVSVTCPDAHWELGMDSKKQRERYLSWIDLDQLTCILWFLYSIGIGVKLFRYDTDKHPQSPPPDAANKEFRWRKRASNYVGILLLLSSVSLLALVAFLF